MSEMTAWMYFIVKKDKKVYKKSGKKKAAEHLKNYHFRMLPLCFEGMVHKCL